MFQEFTATTSPDTGASRLADLRREMKSIDGFLIPRADAHMGENVAKCSERLSWLTGFTGSAGYCAALHDTAGVFVDGRYRLQVREEVDLSAFTPVSLHEVPLGEWLIEQLPNGGVIAYDPWLHGFDEIEKLTSAVQDQKVQLQQTENLIDRIWQDQPAAPQGRISPHPLKYSGEESAMKRTKIGKAIADAKLDACVLTLPDSICWLLNIRGEDIERTPVALCFAIFYSDGRVALFVDPEKCDAAVIDHLGANVDIRPENDFAEALQNCTGAVGVDRSTAPIAVSDLLPTPVWFADPCLFPKAQKNPVEIAGSRAAHLRDGAVMAEFLCWLENEAPSGALTEISVAKKLENFRRNTNMLRDVSFDTISGAGPNGAIVHYRVTDETDRRVKVGELLLIDSGGQYEDGTTDITRTVAIGEVAPETARNNTLVLKGMIAISRAYWPKGISGRDLDGFARMALWQRGLDYDHGTGHGVGAYLGVHEGPQGISRRNMVPLTEGMILSNEPGYYRDGAYGIRIENLVVVNPLKIPPSGERPMHSFETLTFVPIDRRLIVADMLESEERAWLNTYHSEVVNNLSPLVTETTRVWLEKACASI